MLLHTLNLFYFLGLIIALPILLYRIFVKGKDSDTLFQRLGKIQLEQADVWIHGVSVGEVKVALPLVEEIRKNYPNYKIVVSSTSANGLKIARSMYGDKHQVIPFPLDFSWAVKHYIHNIQPKLIILVELEIWPNFLYVAHQEKIPVVLVNGRFSEKSTRNYRYIKVFFKKMTKAISAFLVQNAMYEKRLLSLGISKERIHVTGNIKFDAISLLTPDTEAKQSLANKMKILPENTVIVAGSTHDPEEKYILENYEQLCRSFNHLRLIIVPRHPERKHKVAQYIESLNLKSHYLSELRDSHKFTKHDVIIGDTMGELVRIYSIGDIVYIGGSLIPHGGQNFIEPALQQKAVVCGKHMQNFPDVKLFIEKGFVIQVKHSKELLDVFTNLVNNPDKVTKMGKSAADLIIQLQGSLAKTMNMCNKFL